jgi:hypothetical protein
VPPRPPRRERSQRRKVELWARMLPKWRLPRHLGIFYMPQIYDMGFTSPPKEGVLRIFSPLKIQRLRPSLNTRTWVLNASTLPLDRRSCNNY